MVDLTSGRVFSITDASQTVEARQGAAKLAAGLGFDDTAGGKVALVVTEAGTNLLKHAGGGEVVVNAFEAADEAGLDILALDRGPGMAHVAQCQRDGYSTSGSPGTGLGAIGRLSDVHEIYSQPGRGTALFARICARQRPRERGAPHLEVGGFSIPKRGEEACGDGWSLRPRARGAAIVVVDGLGHGVLAADAAREALTAPVPPPGDGPAAAVQAIHAALRSTRGAAVAVCDVDCERGLVTFAGVGNIAGAIVADGRSRSLVSHNGIVGHQARLVREFTYPWPDDALLVLHSDGLATHWSLTNYPGLAQRHPTLIAGVLYRDFERGRDDVTVVVGKRRAA